MLKLQTYVFDIEKNELGFCRVREKNVMHSMHVGPDIYSKPGSALLPFSKA